ncbi:unnamed protein product [Lepidochelys olivacea]
MGDDKVEAELWKENPSPLCHEDGEDYLCIGQALDAPKVSQWSPSLRQHGWALTHHTNDC